MLKFPKNKVIGSKPHSSIYQYVLIPEICKALTRLFGIETMAQFLFYRTIPHTQRGKTQTHRILVKIQHSHLLMMRTWLGLSLPAGNRTFH